MKTMNRAKIKGKPLDDDCKTAHVCVEFDEDTKYCFCYGIIDLHYDDYIDKCKQCKACERNMTDTFNEIEVLKCKS